MQTPDVGSQPNKPVTLSRQLGLGASVAIGLGAIIGAGLFVVSGEAAAVGGPSFLLGIAVAGIAALLNGLSAAQLAAVYPQSGGTYEYGYRLLHPWAGFAAGWMFLASKLAAGGAVALGFGHYLGRVVPGVNPLIAALSAVVLLTLANLFGIRKAGVLNMVIVSITLSVLLIFLAEGLPHFNVGSTLRSEGFTPNGWAGMAQSAALMFFAYTGYARLATLGEEVRAPERTIPRAIIITISISIVLYLAVCALALSVLGAERMGASRTPLEDAAAAIGPRWLPLAVATGACTAMLGVLLSQVLGISRMMLAMARRNDLPAYLSHIAPSHQVPAAAVVTTGIIIGGIALAGRLEWILQAASFTILLYYTITNLAALRLTAAQRRYPRALAVAGLLLCLAMALSLKWETVVAGLGLLAVGILGRIVLRRGKAA